MTKYITIKLTEDQHRTLAAIVDSSINNYEYANSSQESVTRPAEIQEFADKELAFYRRLQTKLAKAKTV